MEDEKGNIITLEGEDGSSYSCRLLDIFEFEGDEYALLLRTDNNNLVIMRLVQRDDQTIFQTIDSDEEFKRVLAYVEEMARKDEET